MGHCLVYKKYNSCTKEEKEQLYNQCNKFLNKMFKITNNIDIYKDYVNGINDNNIVSFYKNVMDGIRSKFIKNNFYVLIDIDNPLILKRYYIDRSFNTKNELLEHLSEFKNNKYIGFYDDDKNFKSGYTDDVIRHINEYFDKHGEDNLFLKFH